MTRKTLLIAVALIAVVGLTFGFTTTALAFPGVSYAGACSGCHTGPATNPVAVLVSNSGTTATYAVSSGGTEWALFNGTTRVTGAVGSTGQFAVPVPGSYTLFAVNGIAGGGTNQGLGQTSVAVAAPLSHFTIVASAGANGSISPTGSLSATQGVSVVYTFTPDSGFHVAVVTVDGTPIGTMNSYTFTNVQTAHTIAVTFAAGGSNTCTITATAGSNGSINPIGDKQVAAGGSVVYTMQPAEGYQVATLTVDGVPVAKAGWYTFLNVVQAHTISVTFQPNPVGWFTITPYAGEHGEIWMAAQTVLATSTIPGAVVACSIIPDAHYHVASLTIDGASAPPATSYIFYNVRAGHTIAATFAIDTQTLAYTAGAHGSITGSSPQTVNYGTGGTLVTAVPATGYHFVSWSDGVTTAERTDTNATGDISATASFAINTYTLTYTAGANGTITGTSPQTVNYGSGGTLVTAVPASGCSFVSWSDGVTTAARTDPNVTANVNVTATFSNPLITTTMTMNANHTSALRGHLVHFFGVIQPNMPNGTPIAFLVRKAGTTKWVRAVPYARTFNGYHWSYDYHPRTPGIYYIKVRFSATSTHAAANSRTVKVTWR